MTEGTVTNSIIKWLEEAGWRIIDYDYPDSAHGTLIHPDRSISKNKGGIKPDIIAVKGDLCVFFEDKDRSWPKDFKKQNELIHHDRYKDNIHKMLQVNNASNVSNIYYGIGYPIDAHKTGRKYLPLVDFVIGVYPDSNIEVLYSKYAIF